MKRYTQAEWAAKALDGTAALDSDTGDDPQGVAVDGVHGVAMTPDDDTDDVVFVED